MVDVVRTVIATLLYYYEPCSFFYIFYRTIPGVHILSIRQRYRGASMISHTCLDNHDFLVSISFYIPTNSCRMLVYGSVITSFVSSGLNMCISRTTVLNVVLVRRPLPLSATGQPPASPSHRHPSTLEQPAMPPASPTGPRHRHA